MNVVLDLPRPVEARIEQEAHDARVSPAELIAEGGNACHFPMRN